MGTVFQKRRFSVDKHLLDMHGSSTGNDTITTIRVVKDHIVSVAGIANVSVKK